jgi:hypothetical protein
MKGLGIKDQRAKDRWERHRHSQDTYSVRDQKWVKARRKDTHRCYLLLKKNHTKKELELLGDIISINNFWSFENIPEDKREDPVYRIAMHLKQNKRIFICPLEDLPLFIGSDTLVDEVIKWRFKVGR